MATSALLVEIVVMGLLATIAMLLDLHYWLPTFSEALWARIRACQLTNTEETFIILALSYPVGWAVNSAGYMLTFWLYKTVHVSAKFPGNYDVRHALVMQRASDYSSRFLMEHFSMVRIDRASFVISVLCLPASWKSAHWHWTAFPINLLACLFALNLAWKAYIHFKMLSAAVEAAIMEEDVLELMKHSIG